MIKAKVIKLKTLPDKDEKIMNVKSGDVFEGSFENWPEVNKSFVLVNGISGGLRTSTVVEIIGDREFRTLNSIYKIVTERDEKIKIILE